MANRAKRANMYNHDHQIKVNKWKKKLLWYKGKIEMCNQYIARLEEAKAKHPEEADACQDAINDFKEARKNFIEARGLVICNMPKRKKVRHVSKKMKNKS